MQGVASKYKSPLHEMTQSTATCLWNDSASVQELSYSMEHGAVGATCNPVIVLGVLKQEISSWRQRILSLIEELPIATEKEIAWRLVRTISVQAAAVLKPIFDQQQGRNGRLSIQTDPRLFRDAEAMVKQAIEFDGLAPNMIVKIPVTQAGIPAIEEATYRGISIRKLPIEASALMPLCASPCRNASRSPRRSNADSNGASRKGKKSRPWDLYAQSWLAGSTIGSNFRQKRITSRSTRAIWSGLGWQSSRRPTKSFANAVIACVFCRLRSVTTCTGANSSAGMW